MSLAIGLLTVVAGVIYILWQAHKECPGFLTCTAVSVALYLSPLILIAILKEIDETAAVIVGFILIFAICGLGFRWIVTSKDTQLKLFKESQAIWDEVDALPLPDEETLRQVKLACKIPLLPENCKSFNDAAISKWRIMEYNKRYKQKHRFVYYDRNC